MGFNAVYALWLLPLLGLIILMYLLKEEHEEMEISSLYLWKTVMADSEVKKPWQKLKNNILMILQLLAAFIIIIALANPFLKTGKALGGSIIIVLDNSGSMNAQMKGKSRLQMAKSMAENVVREAPSSSLFTIISSARDAKVEISNTKDKMEAINKIKAIEVSNMEGNIYNQMSIIKAIFNQYQDATLLAYTDEPFSLDDMKGEVINLGGNGENAAITSISYSDEKEDYTLLVRVQNTGNSSLKREIALYGDNKLIGLKEAEILPGSSVNVYFYGIKKGYDFLLAELSEEDMLIEDNKAYLILQNPKPKKVLMISKGNIFIEKALSSIEGLELYKTDNSDIIDDSYDLYLFDGKSPKQMPKGGSVFFINPDQKNTIFEIIDSKNSSMARFEKNSINNHIEDYRFFINNAKIIKKPYWADTLIVSGDDTLAGIGKFEGRKTAYISFDIHESDLPLNPAFPIFIYNATSYLADLEAKGRGFYKSGESIDIMFAPDISEAQMTTPSGKVEKISSNMFSYGFNNTGETGIYRFDFKKDEVSSQKLFAVNFPLEESKNAFLEWSASKGEGIGVKNYKTGLDIQKPLIIIVLLILLAEWMVYTRGN